MSAKLEGCLTQAEMGRINIRGNCCCQCKKRYSIYPAFRHRLPDVGDSNYDSNACNHESSILGVLIIYDLSSARKIGEMKGLIQRI
jgi:hypothetical protein